MGRYEYIIEVEKKNIYRDEHGRFTFAPGGGISGAWNDENDPRNVHRDRIANELYTQIHSHNKASEISAVAKHSGMKYEDIERVYNHVFEREHYFKSKGAVSLFDPDYYMAHS